ncbi:hypothetical protein ACFY3N_21755 [Streptomyces sp. NPDC000348]|uniref:YxiG-like protein n=1 Tax=Streptomyces sp. NPDC000348 TaxID=3364538 RepID=UPI0036919ABB
MRGLDAVAHHLEHLDETFDHAVVHHGYTSHLRDYEVIVYMTADPRTDVEPAYPRYLFRYCVESWCESSVLPETWRVSSNDRLTDHETGVDLDGREGRRNAPAGQGC